MTSPTPAWQVIGQVKATEQDTTGNFVQGWRITFQTAGGTQGSIFLSDPMYTVDNVRSAIAAQVETVSAIENLTA